MKNAVLILAGALVTGIALTFAPLNAQPAADGAAEPEVQTWEYLVELEGVNLVACGDQGWELVAVTEKDIGGRKFYFKRPQP